MKDPTVVAEPAVASSFLTRASNVFAAPGDLYAEVATAPVRNSSWSIPFIISLLLTFLVVFSLYNNPALRQQVFDRQEEALQQQVKSGSLTQEQYDTAVSRMESSGPVFFILIGGGVAAVWSAVLFFAIALVFWLVVRFLLKSPLTYMKMLEAYGLSICISILGTIITMLMMNLFNTMYATPSAAAFIMGSFDPGRILDRFLIQLNIFTIWEIVVLGIAIQKVSGKGAGVSMAVPFGLWGAWVILSSIFGWGIR